MHDAHYWIQQLGLTSHPEGGYFRELYRSDERIPKEGLPERFDGARSVSTAIQYLLEAGDFSAFHRIQSDEVWHWYAGGALNVYVLEPNGEVKTIRLGPDPEAGEVFVAVVPAGRWFASRCANESPYALAGCTVSPGFDFADFEMAKRPDLLDAFPHHAALIEELTREVGDA